MVNLCTLPKVVHHFPYGVLDPQRNKLERLWNSMRFFRIQKKHAFALLQKIFIIHVSGSCLLISKLFHCFDFCIQIKQIDILQWYCFYQVLVSNLHPRITKTAYTKTVNNKGHLYFNFMCFWCNTLLFASRIWHKSFYDRSPKILRSLSHKWGFMFKICNIQDSFSICWGYIPENHNVIG
jgi:hypothetical protein